MDSGLKTYINMIVLPSQDSPFLVPQTFQAFFTTVHRALRSLPSSIVSPSSYGSSSVHGRSTCGPERYRQWLKVDRSRPYPSYQPAHGLAASNLAPDDGTNLRLDDGPDIGTNLRSNIAMVSVSLPIVASDNASPTLSPLAALDTLAQPTEQHFYWEKPDLEDAIAAMGTLVERQFSGNTPASNVSSEADSRGHAGADASPTQPTQRFLQTQQILDEWFTTTAIIGALDLPFTGPHAFCRFTFFDQDGDGTQSHHRPFPPASVFIPKWHMGQHHHQKVFVANIVCSEGMNGSNSQLRQQSWDLWTIYQRLRQPIKATTIMERHASNLNRRSAIASPVVPSPAVPSTIVPSATSSSIISPAVTSPITPSSVAPSSLPLVARDLNPAFYPTIPSTTATTNPSINSLSGSLSGSLLGSSSGSPSAVAIVSSDSVPDPLVPPLGQGDRLSSPANFPANSPANSPTNSLTNSLTNSPANSLTNIPWSSTESFGLPYAQQTEFKQSVEAALDAIESTVLTKAVLAQVFDVSVETPFQVFPSLHNLRISHRDSHIFSTANGQGQVFLGASPERLLSIRDRTLYTEAIAGSAPRGNTPEADITLGNNLLANAKELHEHQLVVNYITEQLIQLNLEPQRSAFPKLLQLPHIQHLHTPIVANLPPGLNALDIVGHLHPTPAVAGVPQALACELIQEQESFERSLYAAPIGWVNYRGDSEFIVGIRSTLLDGQTARLYAGAGIVRGSQPDLEVSEIELKLQALLTTLLF